MGVPLAERIRPKTLDEVFGQQHLIGKNKPLRKIAEGKYIPNMIFYGASGTGKTTIASIIAENSGMYLKKLNGTSSGVAEIKDIISELDTFSGYNGILLYLDEIQYLNKKQQQSLLEYIENGKITLIASTTENPYFSVFGAILSRCTVFEFKPLEPQDIEKAVIRGYKFLAKEMKIEIDMGGDIEKYISETCGGDVRKALNTVELSVLSGEAYAGGIRVEEDTVKLLSQKSSMRYDRDGDSHYDILSAFQKSVRGSDENAALHYMARLIEAGDIVSLSRRLLVTASEDIGLAYPQAVSIVKSCVDSALQLGLPEARIPLAQAVILLCTSPKSNSVITAIDTALEDVRNGNSGEIPLHLRDCHYDGAEKLGRGGYKYPHDYPGHYVEQQYLPDNLKDRVYYKFGNNKNERLAEEYRRKLKLKESSQEI